nr:MAG TPA: hypothetical protein [Caudoviricetes sp.]
MNKVSCKTSHLIFFVKIHTSEVIYFGYVVKD